VAARIAVTTTRRGALRCSRRRRQTRRSTILEVRGLRSAVERPSPTPPNAVDPAGRPGAVQRERSADETTPSGRCAHKTTPTRQRGDAGKGRQSSSSLVSPRSPTAQQPCYAGPRCCQGRAASPPDASRSQASARGCGSAVNVPEVNALILRTLPPKRYSEFGGETRGPARCMRSAGPAENAVCLCSTPRSRQRRFRRATGFGRRSGRRASSLRTILRSEKNLRGEFRSAAPPRRNEVGSTVPPTPTPTVSCFPP
jgi:hypothetical protein